MLIKLCPILVLLAAMPGWSQVEPSATGPPSTDEGMRTPPPVSGEAYPSAVGSETRSNYLNLGISLSSTYDDNLLAGDSVKPVGSIGYMIAPTFMLDQTTPRTHGTVSYSPGFTIYQPVNTLNRLNESGALGFQYRLSPHATINLRDSFVQTSDVFDQPNSLPGTVVSGSTQSAQLAVIAPYASTLQNVVNIGFSEQFSRMGMVGASGSFSLLDYPNSNGGNGLYNSNSHGGSVFFNRRLSRAQYFGATYQYSETSSSVGTILSQTQAHTFDFFYTIYLARSISVSVSGGPQYSVISQSTLPTSSSWAPSILASLGWQSNRTNLSGSYSRKVSGGGGLLGAFEATTANANASWQMARGWTVAAAGGYMINKNVTPLSFQSSNGGHTISGSVSIQHPIGERLMVETGYARLHQSYSGIATISENPDSDSAHISISYQLRRPLGR